MADERQQDGICRYLKDMDYEFHEPLGKPGTRFEFDLELIARDAMTKGAQLRMNKASFPQELRLQVMRASVQYHSSAFHISAAAPSETLPKDLKDAVTSLFDTQHTFGALYDSLKALAEQAFFEAAIFNVFTSLSLSMQGNRYSTGPDFDKIAERVQHLELDALILPELEWEATLDMAMSLWASIRLRSPKLKACVFTVVVQTIHHEPSDDEFACEYYGSHDQNPFPKDILSKEPRLANV